MGENFFMRWYLSKNDQRVEVRKAGKDDAKAIEDLVNSVASERHFIVPNRSREDWDVAIEEIKRRKGLIVVGLVDGVIVGMAHLARGKFEKNRHVGFIGISVLKRFRGVGIGTAMMEYIMEWAGKQKDLKKLSLTVFSTNQVAINLYEKFGFTIEGIKKKEYRIGKEFIDDVVMARFLDDS